MSRSGMKWTVEWTIWSGLLSTAGGQSVDLCVCVTIIPTVGSVLNPQFNTDITPHEN